MAKDLPTVAELRKLLSYDPDTGEMRWKPRHPCSPGWNTRHAGKLALQCLDHDGYRKGRINGEPHMAHRVAWALHHGHWPNGQIDHINGIGSDNRAENLRDVTPSENHRNRRTPSNNTSGRIGVRWNKKQKKWWARIQVGESQIFLGAFASFKEACKARSEAEKLHGFHKNHGRN